MKSIIMYTLMLLSISFMFTGLFLGAAGPKGLIWAGMGCAGIIAVIDFLNFKESKQ